MDAEGATELLSALTLDSPNILAGKRDPKSMLTAAWEAPQGAQGGGGPQGEKGYMYLEKDPDSIFIKRAVDDRSSEVPFRTAGRNGRKKRHHSILSHSLVEKTTTSSLPPLLGPGALAEACGL